MKLGLTLSLLLLVLAAPGSAPTVTRFDLRDAQSPLRLVRSIALPNVHGRIDHMALEPERNHLWVAEYGNGSVDDVDLNSGKVAGRIAGLHEPQGIAWLPHQGIAVASGDGSLRFYRAADRQPVAEIALGDDADNMRVDARNGNLVVGYGSGALAVVDPSTHRVIRRLNLPAHPEAFALRGSRVFVNVPDAHQIVIGDLDAARVIRNFDTGVLGGNYPMALDAAGSRLAIAYRFPSRLAVLETQSLSTTWSAPICGDADDVYFRDARIVVVCGEGAVELVEEGGKHDRVRVPTVRGARTGLLVEQRNGLFVAIPGHATGSAVWQLGFR